MAFIPAPNIIQVEMRCTRNAQRVENRVMINNLGSVSGAALNNYAQLCWDWWELTYAPMLSTQVLLNESVATDLTTLTGGQFTYAPDGTTTGEDTSTALPNEVSLCVSLRSSSRGRSARGRFYWLSVCQDQMADSNNVNPGIASAAAAALNTLRTAISGSGGELTIVSYRSEGIVRPGGPVYFPVTNALVVDTVVDSMRRRKPGVGT